MRIILLLLSTLLFSNLAHAVRSEATLKSEMNRLKQLQIKVSKKCLENRDSEKVRVTIDNETYTCPQLIVLTDRLKEELDKEMEEYEKQCNQAAQKTQHAALAEQAADLAKQSVACKPSPDERQCFGKFTCGLFAATAPIRIAMSAAGKASNSNFLRQCAAQGKQVPACLLNILRGIFDSIWGSVKMIWDGAKWLARKTGEFLGIIKRSEAKTSERAMMAQQAGPSFLKKLVTDPVGTLRTMASNLFQSLEESAREHYGCEKWSGIPFRSRCLRPMTTWKCGTCQQKSQVYCGIAGYAVGEIGTAFLTGGLLSGGKVVIKGAVKLGAGPARNVAGFLGRTFPKSSANVAKAAGTVKTLASVGLSAAQKRLISAWDAIRTSRATKVFTTAADRVSRSAAGKAGAIALKPVSLYLRALDNAFVAGQNVVEAGVKGATRRVVTEEALKGAKIADEAMEVATDAAAPALAAGKADDAVKSSSGIVIEASEGSTKVRLVPTIPNRSNTPIPLKVADNVSDTRTVTQTSAKAEQTTAKVADNADEVSDLVKFKTDPEYAALFKGKEMYEGHHDELAMVIRAMEDAQPTMNKVQIRTRIQETLNSCQL